MVLVMCVGVVCGGVLYGVGVVCVGVCYRTTLCSSSSNIAPPYCVSNNLLVVNSGGLLILLAVGIRHVAPLTRDMGEL